MEQAELDSGASGRNYFVDEAGDAILFNRDKRVVVGSEGCSTYFILGFLDVADPDRLANELEERRAQLLADPYFKGAPSLRPEQRKTALAFHAKDDLPEIRREVFSSLIGHEISFSAVVRDKRRILELVREHNRRRPSYRYHPNQLYDRCVSRLFRDRLHKDAAYRIVFARRGTADRTTALRQALENARSNFRHKWGIQPAAPIEVIASDSAKDPCLQAADYFLWALQRLYEKKESRYWQFVWSKVSVVYDIDDIRRNSYGEFYNQRNPLDVVCVEKRRPGI